MSIDFKIVPLRADKISQAAELEELCFSHPTPNYMLAQEYIKPESIYLAAVMEDRLLGYVGMQSVLDEGYIMNLCVHPNFRRNGIAKALIELLIAGAKKVKLSFITLEVRASNDAAKALYESFGFEKVGERKDYYETPREDAELMTLFFKAPDKKKGETEA